MRATHLQLRRDGLGPAEATETLGFIATRLDAWEAAVGDTGRHHLQVDVEDEATFWAAFEAAQGLAQSSHGGRG